MLEIKNLSVTAELKNGMRNIVSHVSFDVDRGERLAIVGESGCGKTMTAMAVFNLLPDNCKASGEIILDGINLLSLTEKQMNSNRGSSLVFIPQNGSEFLNPILKVKYQIAESLKKLGIRDDMIKGKSEELLLKVGFEHPFNVMDQYSFQLSGGMAQRVILAIGLASAPKLVIADEPTRGLDDENASLYINQLTEIFSNSAVIVITHNIKMAKVCSKLVVMYGGEIMEYGSTEEILNQRLHPYTQSLINALPENGFYLNEKTRFTSLNHLDAGCPFYFRCPSSEPICKVQKPHIKEEDGIFRRCIHA